MTKKCTICGKKGRLAWKLLKLRGKYNPTIKRKQYPNLQWVRIPRDIQKPVYKKFAGKRILICTKCIKAMEKIK